MSDEEAPLVAAEERIFAAIKARDVGALEAELSEDFVHSSLGGSDQARDAFLQAIRDMPYTILELGGEALRVRIVGGTAIVSGLQRARVGLPAGEVVDASTGFVDVFVKSGGAWRLCHAVSVELPQPVVPGGEGR